MNDAVKAFEVLGVLILILGGFLALVGCVIELARGGAPSRAFDEVRARLGRAILLGLEILVVADIIRTIVVTPTLSSALSLGLIVVVRIALSFAIDVEVEWVAPWRKAATVSKDVGTTVTGIQTAITLYTLVMAMLMIPGGKVGSLIGGKRAFSIGCVIYGAGSLTTALAPNLTVLIIGLSLLEGIGAALILPAIVALVAGNFPPEGRPRAYGLVMAAGAIAVALGPLIGGIATTYFS